MMSDGSGGELKTLRDATKPGPGPMRTGMRAKAMPGEDPETLPHPAELAPHILEMASPGFQRGSGLFAFPTKSYTEWSLSEDG